MYRLLKPGGKLILTTRFIFPLHDIPHDYYRFTIFGLKYLLKNFENVTIKAEVPTLKSVAVLLERISMQCETLNFTPFRLFWFILARIIGAFSFLITTEYGMEFSPEKTNNILTSGYHVIAYKPKQI